MEDEKEINDQDNEQKSEEAEKNLESEKLNETVPDDDNEQENQSEDVTERVIEGENEIDNELENEIKDGEKNEEDDKEIEIILENQSNQDIADINNQNENEIPEDEPSNNTDITETENFITNDRNLESDDKVSEEIQDDQIHKRVKLEKKVIPTDMFYDYNEMVSQPFITEESGLPIDLVKFTHSAGYDCQKRDNLILIDSDRLCYISGNFVEFLDMRDHSQFLLRSLSGQGIGCITIHPTRKYLAVGEKCKTDNPVVAIYELESMKLYRLLREGTEKAYSYCQFNTSGALLATVGSDPDFMITVWEWENEQIILRSKAFSQDIYRVSWSVDLEGILTTAGSGHIKFWKMADTFTGLKLQGHIGKFGKTEISDIEGFVILPDGKVLSGCEWGNMLVWDGDLIKVQICRKKKPCHSQEISQIIIEEGELMTVGKDGWIKTWDFETIDTAEVSEEMAMYEMEPMNEVSVAPDAKLMHIVKSIEHDSSIWYAQDANGRIWKLDLSFSHTSHAPKIIASFHSGSIKDCDVSPLSYMSASIGNDGCIRVFDFVSRTLLAEHKFPSDGCKILWSSLKIDPKGKMIISGHTDGVVRITYFTEAFETDISKKSKFKGELSLIQALKPHTKAITALCTDDEGRILMTGSEDQTVFFFSISKPNFEPLGFVKFAQSIRLIEWKPTKHKEEPIGRIIVYLDNGEVVEVICPSPDKLDHSVTYEIQEIQPLRSYKFMSIKSKLRHEEELERKRLEEEERQKVLAKTRKERLERGLDTLEDQMKQIEEDKKRVAAEAAKEEEWVAFIPDEPSPILFGFSDKNDPDKFWLSMGSYDAGYIYKCEFASTEKMTKMRVPEKYNEAVSSHELSQSNDIPITCLKWSKSGMRLLMGLQDGSLRLQTVATPFDLSTMQSCWQFPMHDSDYGYITSICMSHDEKFIITVGNDGNYFVYELMNEELQQTKVEEFRARLPSASIPVRKDTIEDIDDPKAYSIEEHKQKSEHDKKLKLAQKKKEDTLKKIAELQRQFKQLKIKNEALPQRIRFPDSEFELVPQLREDLMIMRDHKIELVHKQMAFDAEKCRLLLEKLEKRFLEPLESDHIEVHAIESEHTVSTIRGCELSEEYHAVVAALDAKTREMHKKDFSWDQTFHDQGKMDNDETDGLVKHEDGLLNYDLKGARGMRVARQLKKLEDNKNKRSQRKAEWDALFATKPPENYEDPKDIEAIQEAKEKMGDFKLKSSDDYFIPEKDRPNTYKAQTVLIATENYIYAVRSSFNNKVKDLIATKIQIIELVKKTNEKIQECNALSIKDHRYPIHEVYLHPSENPDKKFEYTKESLLQFKKELEDRKKAAIQGEDNAKTGFTTYSKTQSDNTAMKPNNKFRPPTNQSNLPSNTSVGGNFSNEMRRISSTDQNIPSTCSNWQEERRYMQQLRTVYMTDKMIKEALRQIRVFDMRLRLLRYERSKLSVLLKRALLNQLTTFEEYRLLKQCEKNEGSLTEKTELKLEEKTEITNKIQDFQNKIDFKKKDIEKLNERSRVNVQKFKESLGENNKFEDYLTKVFKKKIKRRKKEQEGNEDESEEEDSDDDDSDLEESDVNSDEESQVYDLDMCPPQCSQDLYDGTCQLREVQMDIDEELAEEKRQLDTFKKEQEKLTSKLRVVENGLTQAKKELEAFQMEKQQKLNLLKTCVILTTQQILYHENGQLMPNLDAALVFEANNYRGLKARIHQLHEEEIQQKKYGKEVKSRHMRLHQNKKLFQKKISETQMECNEMMKAKFGKLDNLEKMEQVMINPKIEELTFKMLQLQQDNYLTDSSLEDKIREAQELCIVETKTNTCILNNMLDLYNEKEAYESKLNSKQKKLGSEFQLSEPKSEEDIGRLNQLVQIQAQELEALKEEIGMLSRKGGHILPPLTSSNVMNSSNLYSGEVTGEFDQHNTAEYMYQDDLANDDLLEDGYNDEEEEQQDDNAGLSEEQAPLVN